MGLRSAPVSFVLMTSVRKSIAKQLRYAGENEQIFSDSTLKKIYDYSSGLPRMINRACTLSLSLAYQTNRLIVDDRMVGEALEEEVT